MKMCLRGTGQVSVFGDWWFRQRVFGVDRTAMKHVVAVASLPLLAVGSWTQPSAVQARDLKNTLSGLYSGVYYCSSSGLVGVTLDLTVEPRGQASGALAFYPLMLNPKAAAGSFRMSGSVRNSSQLSLQPGTWIQEPSSNYGAAGLEALIDSDRIVGKPIGPDSWGCQFIEMKRVPALR